MDGVRGGPRPWLQSSSRRGQAGLHTAVCTQQRGSPGPPGTHPSPLRSQVLPLAQLLEKSPVAPEPRDSYAPVSAPPPPPTGLSARVLNPDVLTPHGAFPRLPALMLWRQQPSPGNKTQRWETTGVVRLFASVPPGTSSPRTAAGAPQRSGVVRARTGGSTASCTDRAWRALTRDPAGVRNWEWHEGDRHSHVRAARHKPQ